jgi:hypothetical protein
VVIDSDMNVFPTAVKLAPAAAIGTRNYAGEAPQLFDVLCQRFTGTTRGPMRTGRAIVQAS